MTFRFEDVTERLRTLPDSHESTWTRQRIGYVANLFSVEFAGIGEHTMRDFERNALHLRLLEQYGHMRDHNFSDGARQAVLDIASDFAIESGMHPESMQANWAKIQESEF